MRAVYTINARRNPILRPCGKAPNMCIQVWVLARDRKRNESKQ